MYDEYILYTYVQGCSSLLQGKGGEFECDGNIPPVLYGMHSISLGPSLRVTHTPTNTHTHMCQRNLLMPGKPQSLSHAAFDDALIPLKYSDMHGLAVIDFKVSSTLPPPSRQRPPRCITYFSVLTKYATNLALTYSRNDVKRDGAFVERKKINITDGNHINLTTVSSVQLKRKQKNEL